MRIALFIGIRIADKRWEDYYKLSGYSCNLVSEISTPVTRSLVRNDMRHITLYMLKMDM